MADNVYHCLKCGEWFPTRRALKDHVCERVLDRDGGVLYGKTKRKKDPHKEERRKIGERLKELGVIQKRSEINFTEMDELKSMVEKAEAELEE